MADTAVTLAILGASGDLTKRLLLPGLGTLLTSKPEYRVTLVGAAAEDLTTEEWRDRVRASMADTCSAERVDALASTSGYVTLDVTDTPQMRDFLAELAAPGNPIVLYFALPPAISQAACEVLAQLELPDGIRLAIEKPFGSSLESAKAFNALLSRMVPEEQIFRIDHYLGKATVLNLLGLRFGNRVLHAVWNADNIERVEIIEDEKLALEGRAGYYDRAGAAKDMIQSHLLLVLAMVAMEEPASIDAVELRDLMEHALRATHLWHDDPTTSRRARYTAGHVNGKDVPDYAAEEGVDPANETETLAEITVEIRNARWAGVPFRLRSGKALGDGVRSINVIFKPVAHTPGGFHNDPPPNVVAIGLTPESIAIGLATNGSGSRWDFEQTAVSAQIGESPLRPYGEILDGIISGDPLLSVRGDIAEECWRIISPVFDAWASGAVPLDTYRAGSAGPVAWR